MEFKRVVGIRCSVRFLKPWKPVERAKIQVTCAPSEERSIESFTAERGLQGHGAIVAGNRIRGFLVHNGVFIQGKASIR